MCIRCGKKIESQSGVPFGYIHKSLRLANDEVTCLHDSGFRSLLQRKKLHLVLALDHTFLNSTQYKDIIAEEEYLQSPTDPLRDVLKGSLFRLDSMLMFTKLRPFVHTFLKEASNLFEMYIYTLRERAHALEMTKVLDPENVYFNSRVITQGDGSQIHHRGLDLVLSKESGVLILDVTEAIWANNTDNLILMERYCFFASSCEQFGFHNSKSLSELKRDESDVNGALARVLEVLKRVHSRFFDPELKKNLPDRDARQMAEQLGATCSTEVDPFVTHVISADDGSEKSRWAVKENKFLVNPRWIEAANYLWQKQPEENFPVSEGEVQDQ